ncbi:hypothetical protein OIU74_014161 [Salix koriyanagi]|uniref:Uncharacterized protein n=1 Tax=Salix koriyanagi TaxID=2511006 RepID=A0A9Q0PV51_9ROSI|nr:hypothetical protein OIU74_014161 [Salix koriyanagi]
MLSKLLTARGKTTSIGSPSRRVFVTATSRPLQDKKDKLTAEACQSVTEAAESVKEGARSVKKAAESVRAVTNMSKEVTKIISETAETITDKAASIIKEKVVGK